MTVYLCEDSLEGILCGVYDAWMGKKGHANVRLELEGEFEQELFTEYCTVSLERNKVSRVIESIRNQICEEAYENVYAATLSQDMDKADKIYRFLIYGFHFGKRIMKMLQIPEVFQLFQLCRNVYNENHLLTGFIRFTELKENGLLFSRIAPKNAVIPLLAVHFSDRLPNEKWIIYDANRRQAAVHNPQTGWAIFYVDDREAEEMERWQKGTQDYEQLWKIFHSAVAIRERENRDCQRNHLPLRFREYMTEFYGD